MDTIKCTTACGEIEGLDFGDYAEYRGIRYATAERFEYPKQVTHWEGTYKAVEYGECAYQHRAFEDDATVNAFYHNEFRKGLKFTYSEDCLFLNISVPKNAKNCPVLLYIHGGSFTGGSANEGHVSGARFAKNGIIFVSINYRLGAFGFCSHPDLADENGICGNYGLYDQAAAISWVKNNISSFGGDSSRITLIGQSAGAMSVDIHMSNPLVKDKVCGAIMQSGAGLQRFILKPLQNEKTVPFWNSIVKNAGLSNAKELKTVDAQRLYFAWKKACKENKLSIVYTLPTYDGVILKKGSFNQNTIADKPYIISTTATDMMPPILRKNAVKWAKYAEKNNKGKCYIYNFTRLLPGDDKGAWHSSDLLYAFSTLDFNWRPFEEVDYKISQQLSDAIISFAKTGDPNCDSIPVWSAGYEKQMYFCENTHCSPKEAKNIFKSLLNARK